MALYGRAEQCTTSCAPTRSARGPRIRVRAAVSHAVRSWTRPPDRCTWPSGSARSTATARWTSTCTRSRRASTSSRARPCSSWTAARTSSRPGACGVVPVGVRHAWVGRAGETRAGSTCTRRNLASTPSAARTRSSSGRRPTDREPAPLDVRDPRTRNLFRLDDGQMDLDRLKAGAAVDAADRLGEHGHGAARLQRDRGEDAGRPAARRPAAHDVHGRVRARRRRPPARPPARGGVRDPRGRGRGRTPTASSYTLRAGDVFWTGVGCVHAFYNRTDGHVRWLETQSPQPPARHSYRFNRDWEYLQSRIV